MVLGCTSKIWPHSIRCTPVPAVLSALDTVQGMRGSNREKSTSFAPLLPLCIYIYMVTHFFSPLLCKLHNMEGTNQASELDASPNQGDRRTCHIHPSRRSWWILLVLEELNLSVFYTLIPNGRPHEDYIHWSSAYLLCAFFFFERPFGNPSFARSSTDKRDPDILNPEICCLLDTVLVPAVEGVSCCGQQKKNAKPW